MKARSFPEQILQTIVRDSKIPGFRLLLRETWLLPEWEEVILSKVLLHQLCLSGYYFNFPDSFQKQNIMSHLGFVCSGEFYCFGPTKPLLFKVALISQHGIKFLLQRSLLPFTGIFMQDFHFSK